MSSVKRAEVIWSEDRAVVRCLEGDIKALEAARLLEVVADHLSIAEE